MEDLFPTDLKTIQSRILKINPIEYSKTINYLDGKVNYISPYLTHGVITTADVAHTAISRYGKKESRTFIFELAWKEYWNKVWSNLKNIIEDDIDKPQDKVIHYKLIKSIINAQTGIKVIDKAINNLYTNGHLHFTERMWIASLTCNIGQSHWKYPSKWMYYYLLDGDIAGNSLNWQSIAGTFGGDKYYVNQESINKYSRAEQYNTFLDKSLKEIRVMKVPFELQELVKDLELKTELPQSQITEIDSEQPVLLFNMWNINPIWHAHKKAQKVLVLEPSHFNKFPISSKRIEFILNLAKNIPDLKLFVGEIYELKGLNRCKDVISINHQCTNHWPGKKEERDCIFKEVNGKFKSFENFWEEAEEAYIDLKI